MWTIRAGKEGLKITFSQSTATSRPSGWTAKEVGCCIQLLAAMIQKAEMSVPRATAQVAKTCRPRPTRFQPNSITPRKLDSRKKAVSTSKAIRGPTTEPARAEKALQLVPIS